MDDCLVCTLFYLQEIPFIHATILNKECLGYNLAYSVSHLQWNTDSLYYTLY
jgi:hypothetical protein